MFKNEYQGGAFLDVLNIQGKDLSSKCKVHGTSINGGSREFDKSVKSYVLILEGESTRTRIVIPKDAKQSLCILQSFLVLQLWVAAGLSFSIEVTIIDLSNQKRRVLLSTSYKDISVTSFHVKIPLTTMRRGLWLNFCLDLKSIVEDCFKGQSFKTIDGITICANCRLRRVFTLRCQPKDDFINTVLDSEGIWEEIPKSLQIGAASNVQYGTQVLNMEALKAADIKFRVGSGLSSSSITGTEHSKVERSERTHIAFGSRVAMPKNSSKLGNSTSAFERQISSVSSVGDSSASLCSSQNDLSGSIPLVEVQRPVLQPRPPKPNSSKKIRRPNPRIRSADRVAKRPKLKSDDDNYDDDNDESCSNVREGKPTDLFAEASSGDFERAQQLSNGMNSEVLRKVADENNNSEIVSDVKSSVLCSVSEKFVEMKMGSQEDEEEYFRRRNDSESQEDSIRSKDGSFSSTNGSEPFFLYSSRPRSVQNISKSRKGAEVSLKNIEVQSETKIDEEETSTARNGVTLLASLESDFHRESSDSEADDAISKIRRLNGIRKSTPSPKSKESAKIKSSLLKEISPPSHYDHLKYTSMQSDSMSWLYESDSSHAISYNQNDNSLENTSLSPVKVHSDISPKVRRLRVNHGLPDEVGSDSEDVMSDTSDETSYSAWKEPPSHIRNYRYQDEMHGVGMTLDLSVTLPMTPYIEERSSHEKERAVVNSDSGISLQGSQQEGSRLLQGNEVETELDLLFDPILNCYYDPKSHKYYELT